MMPTKESSKENAFIRVLPYEYYDMVKKQKEKIANGEYDESLELANYIIHQELMPYADTVPRSELIDGSLYGFFQYSPLANAWRHGKLLTNHGELYLTVWRYCKEADAFWNTNAWGQTAEKFAPNKYMAIKL